MKDEGKDDDDDEENDDDDDADERRRRMRMMMTMTKMMMVMMTNYNSANDDNNSNSKPKLRWVGRSRYQYGCLLTLLPTRGPQTIATAFVTALLLVLDNTASMHSPGKNIRESCSKPTLNQETIPRLTPASRSCANIDPIFSKYSRQVSALERSWCGPFGLGSPVIFLPKTVQTAKATDTTKAPVTADVTASEWKVAKLVELPMPLTLARV